MKNMIKKIVFMMLFALMLCNMNVHAETKIEFNGASYENPETCKVVFIVDDVVTEAVVPYGHYIEVSEPVKDGYKFIGWLDERGTYINFDWQPILWDMTHVAVWEEGEYKLGEPNKYEIEVTVKELEQSEDNTSTGIIIETESDTEIETELEYEQFEETEQFEENITSTVEAPTEDTGAGNKGNLFMNFMETMKKLIITMFISLMIILVIISLLLLYLAWLRKVYIHNDVNKDYYKDEEFVVVYVTHVHTEGNPLAQLFKKYDRVWRVLIPEDIIENRETDQFLIEFNKRFCKKYNGEQLIIINQSENEDAVKELGFVVDAEENVINFNLKSIE